MKSGYLSSPRYRDHLTGYGHPERPDRLDAIDRMMLKNGLIERVTPVSPRLIDLDVLSKVHDLRFLNDLISLRPSSDFIYLDPDTPISSESLATARWAAGGICQAVDDIFSGAIQNAFCAIRPPGHHAGISSATGFCLINHVAVAARYAQEKFRLKRIAILDWDVHHGNGTQEIFYEDPSVFYFSVHQYPFYPGTGASEDIGEGEGEGATLNVPLSRGSGDREYLNVFENILVHKMALFKPDLIILSAGFDAHQMDPLAQMEISTEGFGKLTRIVKQMAGAYCDGKLVSVLEGGYHLTALGESVATHMQVLLE
ncbi:MAG: histone deacetylase [Nitrospirae bacterium]|nr:histone deacetylase [Nitrospirota bacterium]MBI3594960.1 histone deacetylase [Nitrospirota bacterium]